MSIIDTEKRIGEVFEINTMHGKKKVEVVHINVDYICKNENGKHVLISGERIKE